MLPCAYKSLLGIDCPVCGAQRSFYLLLRGDITGSFGMYPPLVPVLLCMVLFAMRLVNRKIISAGRLRSFSVAVLILVILNYIFKLVTGA